VTATSPAKRPTRRSPRPVVLLRPVPGRSAVHELWAGTKLIMVFGFSVLLTIDPGWLVIGTVAALLSVAARIAHIPRGALPSVPRWLWIWLAIGGITATLAGGSPVIQVSTVSFGLGGLLTFLRLTALSIVLLGLGAMVSWTTNVAEIAPAVSALGRPLGWLRIPIEDWSVALALALRAFPMLVDEFRVLFAARRLRPKQRLPTRWARLRRQAGEVIDLIVAIVTVTLRRADEMGDAITARGGAGQISANPSRPKPADWVALLLVAVVCGAALTAQLGLS
jgi:energy-coupling factor transport system permease protein